MAAFTANQVSITNGQIDAVIISGEGVDQVQYGDFLVIGDLGPAQINRTYLNTDNLPVIELVKPWQKSTQVGQPAIVIPTTVQFKESLAALKNTNTLFNDNMAAMQDWQTTTGKVTFNNLDGTQTTIKTLKQMEFDLYALMEQLGWDGAGPAEPEPNDPSDYIASLDGLRQAWVLSTPINYSPGDRVYITSSQPGASYDTLIGTTNNSTLLRRSSNGSIVFGGCTVRLNGAELVSGATQWPVGESYFEVTFTVAGTLAALCVRSESNSTYFEGYAKNFADSIGHEIPLNNKNQGSTQLATAGNINATMSEYDESVWINTASV